MTTRTRIPAIAAVLMGGAAAVVLASTLAGCAKPGSAASRAAQPAPPPQAAAQATTQSPVATQSASPARAAGSHRWFGLFMEGAPGDITILEDEESRLETKTPVINYFQDAQREFPRDAARNADDHGSVMMITLEFWGNSAKDVARGSSDALLRQFADDAKSHGGTIWLRPFHEMNGNWYPWAGTQRGVSPSDVVAAWRHVKTLFAQEDATNVKFVWCPNAGSVPNTPANAIAKYWPGDAYVDYIALDGYNQGGSSWESFESIFTPAYRVVTSLSRSKPVFIAETGSSVQGGDKARWIEDMFEAVPKKFPRVQGIVWFNIKKERDWRLDSSAGSLAAFRAGIAKL